MSRILRLILLIGLIATASTFVSSAPANADVCYPGEIYCMPDAEIQLHSTDPCVGNVAKTFVYFHSCITSSGFDNKSLGESPGGGLLKTWNIATGLMGDPTELFAKPTQLIQNDVQNMITFVLVDQLSGKNTNLNPVLTCSQSQGFVLRACADESEWFLGQYSLMKTVGLYVALPLFFLMVIQAISHGSLYHLLKGALVMLPLSILGAIFALYFMQQALNITDDFSNYIINKATVGIQVDSCTMTDGQKVVSTTCGLRNSLVERSVGDSGLFISFIWLILLAFASISIYLELLGRQIGVYTMALVMPLALAGLVWPRSVTLGKKIVQYELALIISKIFIVAAISLGLGAFAQTNTTDLANAGSGRNYVDSTATNEGFQTYATGALVFLLAAFAGAKVVSLSPAAVAATTPVWTRSNIASRAQAVAAVQQRHLQALGRRLNRALPKRKQKFTVATPPPPSGAGSGGTGSGGTGGAGTGPGASTRPPPPVPPGTPPPPGTSSGAGTGPGASTRPPPPVPPGTPPPPGTSSGAGTGPGSSTRPPPPVPPGTPPPPGTGSMPPPPPPPPTPPSKPGGSWSLDEAWDDE